MKLLYIILGSISLGLGIAGIFLPLLPTTPFLLLTAALYMKSSKRLYGWLMSNRYLGPYIHNYRERRSMTLASKVVSLALLWVSILFCIFFVVNPLWLKILLGAVLVGVTTHILSFRTMRKEEIVRMVRVCDDMGIAEVASMADTIWREYYSSFIPAEQIDYMLDSVQSPEAIKEQVTARDYEYYFIRSGSKNIGYAGLQPGDGKMKLSKLYILREHRGRGYAREAMTFIENLCRRRRLCAVWLTVNRNNTPSMEIYRKSGFEVVREEVADIGGGFVMDDYIMEKTII